MYDRRQLTYSNSYRMQFKNVNYICIGRDLYIYMNMATTHTICGAVRRVLVLVLVCVCLWKWGMISGAEAIFGSGVNDVCVYIWTALADT